MYAKNIFISACGIRAAAYISSLLPPFITSPANHCRALTIFQESSPGFTRDYEKTRGFAKDRKSIDHPLSAPSLQLLTSTKKKNVINGIATSIVIANSRQEGKERATINIK